MDRWAIPTKAVREIDELLNQALLHSKSSSSQTETTNYQTTRSALEKSVTQLSSTFDCVLMIDSLFDHFLHIVWKRPKCFLEPSLIKSITTAVVSLWDRNTPEEISKVGVRNLNRFLQEAADLVDCTKGGAMVMTSSSSCSSVATSKNNNNNNNLDSSNSNDDSYSASQYSPGSSLASIGIENNNNNELLNGNGSEEDTLVVSSYSFTIQFSLTIVSSLLDVLANFVIPANRHDWFNNAQHSSATSSALRVISLIGPDLLDEEVVADIKTISQSIISNIGNICYGSSSSNSSTNSSTTSSTSTNSWRVAAALASDLARGIEARKYIAENFEALASHPQAYHVVTSLLDGSALSGTPMPRSLCRRLLNDSNIHNSNNNNQCQNDNTGVVTAVTSNNNNTSSHQQHQLYFGCRVPALVALSMDGVGCEVMNISLHQTRGLFSLVFADVLRRYQPLLARCGPHTAQIVHWAQAQPALEDCLVFVDPTRCDEEIIVPRNLVAYTEAVSRWTRSLSKLRHFEQEVFSSSATNTNTNANPNNNNSNNAKGGLTRLWLDKLQSLFHIPELCLGGSTNNNSNSGNNNNNNNNNGNSDVLLLSENENNNNNNNNSTSSVCQLGSRCTKVHLEGNADVAALRTSAGNRSDRIFTRSSISRGSVNVPLTIVVPEANNATFTCNTSDTEPTAGLVAYLDKEWPIGIPITADMLCAQHATRDHRCANPRQCRQIHVPPQLFREVLDAHALVLLRNENNNNNDNNNTNSNNNNNNNNANANAAVAPTISYSNLTNYGSNFPAAHHHHYHHFQHQHHQQQQQQQSNTSSPNNNNNDLVGSRSHVSNNSSSRTRMSRGGFSQRDARTADRSSNHSSRSPNHQNQENHQNRNNSGGSNENTTPSSPGNVQPATETKSTGTARSQTNLAAAFSTTPCSRSNNNNNNVKATTAASTTEQGKDEKKKQQQEEAEHDNNNSNEQHYNRQNNNNNNNNNNNANEENSAGQPSTTASSGTALSAIIARHVRNMHTTSGGAVFPSALNNNNNSSNNANNNNVAAVVSSTHSSPVNNNVNSNTGNRNTNRQQQQQNVSNNNPVNNMLFHHHHHQHFHHQQHFMHHHQHAFTVPPPLTSSSITGNSPTTLLHPSLYNNMNNNTSPPSNHHNVPPPSYSPPSSNMMIQQQQTTTQQSSSAQSQVNSNTNNNNNDSSPHSSAPNSQLRSSSQSAIQQQQQQSNSTATIPCAQLQQVTNNNNNNNTDATSTTTAKVRDCKYFKLGCCDKGASCRFRHNESKAKFHRA